MVRTVRFHEHGGPEVLRLEDVAIGEPGLGEVLIRVDAIGINRAEALFRGGNYIEPVRRFPARLGTKAAGVVEAVGAGVTGIEAGRPVSVLPAFSMNDHGVYAERAIVPAAAVVERPDGLGAVEGAAVWMPYLTAYGALLEVGGMRAGDTVVVTAASSSVGLAAIRVARHVGEEQQADVMGEDGWTSGASLYGRHVNRAEVGPAGTRWLPSARTRGPAAPAPRSSGHAGRAWVSWTGRRRAPYAHANTAPRL